MNRFCLLKGFSGSFIRASMGFVVLQDLSLGSRAPGFVVRVHGLGFRFRGYIVVRAPCIALLWVQVSS